MMKKNWEEEAINQPNDPELLFLVMKDRITSLEDSRRFIQEKIIKSQCRIFFIENVLKMIERNIMFECNTVEHAEEYKAVLRINMEREKIEIEFNNNKLSLIEKELEIRINLHTKLFFSENKEG